MDHTGLSGVVSHIAGYEMPRTIIQYRLQLLPINTLFSLHKSTSTVREFSSKEACLRVDRGFESHQTSGSYRDLLLRRLRKNHPLGFQKKRGPDTTTDISGTSLKLEPGNLRLLFCFVVRYFLGCKQSIWRFPG